MEVIIYEDLFICFLLCVLLSAKNFMVNFYFIMFILIVLLREDIKHIVIDYKDLMYKFYQ